MRRKISASVDGGRAEGLACADPGARTPIGGSVNSFSSLSGVLFMEMTVERYPYSVFSCVISYSVFSYGLSNHNNLLYISLTGCSNGNRAKVC